jgi:hypothetical protein
MAAASLTSVCVRARAPSQATAMKRKFMAADLNWDGMVDSAELKKTNLLDIDARLEDFDIVTKDGKAGLDAYEFSLLLSLHDKLVQDQLHRESDADLKWSRAVALEAATHIVLLGDDNMDGMLSMEEARKSYGCTRQDFDMMLRLGGRTTALDPKLYESAEDMEHEKQRQQTQVAQLLVAHIGKVIYGMVAAVAGNKWADSEHTKGFSVVEAVRLTFKLADYDNDGFVSRAESALLSMPQALFSALSPDGDNGKQLSLNHILNALEDVSSCEDVLVVDRLGEISLKTLYMPHGKCSLLIMPGWNLPASYAVSEDPTCPDKGSEMVGSGAGNRRLLAHGKMSKTETAPKSPRSSRPPYTAASRTSRDKLQSGDKKPKAKFATRNLLRSVVAGHHMHPLVSTALSGADLNAKVSMAKKYHQNDVKKRTRAAEAAEPRRSKQLQQALKRLRSKRPASRELGHSRRSDLEQAMAKSMEQSAVRLARGARGRLGKFGMRAYRRAVKTNSGGAAHPATREAHWSAERVWQSLKGALNSMRARIEHTHTEGTQQPPPPRLRRQDVRKTARRSRAFAKARQMVKNKFKWPAASPLASHPLGAVQRQAEEEHGARKLLQQITYISSNATNFASNASNVTYYETSAPSPSESSANDVVLVCTRWVDNRHNTFGEEYAGKSTTGPEGCLKMVMKTCPDAPLITFKGNGTEMVEGSCYCQHGSTCYYDAKGKPVNCYQSLYDMTNSYDRSLVRVCEIESVEYTVASGANPPPTAIDLTGEEYVKLFGMFPEMLEETAASIERALEMHNEYRKKLGQAPVSTEAFMEIMVKVGMPRELADMLVSHISGRGQGSGMEETASTHGFGFVARVLNGCTLRALAMNYSTGKEYKEQGQVPYCGLPWTVGQRVVRQMDSNGDGVISPHETCMTPSDFAKVAGFGKRPIGQGRGLSSSKGSMSLTSSDASPTYECPLLPVFGMQSVYWDSASQAYRIYSYDQLPGLCHSNPACEVRVNMESGDQGYRKHFGVKGSYMTLEQMGAKWDRSLQFRSSNQTQVQPEFNRVYVAGYGGEATCAPKGLTECDNNYQLVYRECMTKGCGLWNGNTDRMCESRRGCHVMKDTHPTLQGRCIPSPVKPAQENSTEIKFASRCECMNVCACVYARAHTHTHVCVRVCVSSCNSDFKEIHRGKGR